ncbi:uracil phosphoribosyltransferase [Zhouia sp. PK063]|uniref:uracil phosphoribosyltransferase n=1 Tax=Zhouia sp. PK063 TaxID=3373602 RepID=UPI0037BBD3CF
MKVHHLAVKNSILHQFLCEIRSLSSQHDRMRFRRNIERIGEILGYELSKTLHYHHKEIHTPLGTKQVNLMNDQIVLCSVLRAGMPLHQGLLNYFDCAENAFISAYRKHTSETDFKIVVEYLATPNLEDKILILADPMLATGQSLVATYEAIIKNGTPKEIHLAAVIGAQEGVDFIADKFPEQTNLWIADIDPHLNGKGYIVPGLGDAGDLSYGCKL